MPKTVASAARKEPPHPHAGPRRGATAAAVKAPPAAAAFGRKWNDDLDDEGRQRLKELIPVVVGTATGAADDAVRGWMLTDWMIRVYTPAWLELATLTDQAAALRALPPITDVATLTASAPSLAQAREKAAGAWAAARDAAWDAAGPQARAAAAAALKPTVVSLQESAIALVRSMAAVGRGELAP